MKNSLISYTKKCASIALAFTLAISLCGCGKDKKETETTTTQEAESNVICDDERLSIVDEGNKVVITTKDTSSIWYADTYETEVVELTITEDVGIYTFTISPKTEGYAAVDIIGEGAENRVIYPISFDVDKDLNMATTFNSFEFFQFEDSAETPGIDEDLNTIMQDSIDAMGTGNYPDPYMVRPIDMASTDDMLYTLGVESVTGMEKAAIMEPMMSSIAFSLAVVKFDSADNATAAATTLYDSAPQDKWVCVLPEGVFTKVVDDTYLIVLMGPQASIDALK